MVCFNLKNHGCFLSSHSSCFPTQINTICNWPIIIQEGCCCIKMVETVCLFSCFGMVSFTPFVYIVTCEQLAETQTFRVLMDQLVLALTYLILLKCAHARLPPICASWSEVTSEDLWDLHHVLALHMHGDGLAEEVSLAVRGAYNWDQLRQCGKVLSEMWFRVVRKQVPLPHALRTAIHFLEKRLAVPRLPCFPVAAQCRNPHFVVQLGTPGVRGMTNLQCQRCVRSCICIYLCMSVYVRLHTRMYIYI